MTAIISVFLSKYQMEWFLLIDKLNKADCTALKKVMIAVLEYWQGYLFPIFA